MTGKRVSNVNGREVCAGGPLCGLVELSLITTLNVCIHRTLIGKYPNLFRAVFLTKEGFDW